MTIGADNIEELGKGGDSGTTMGGSTSAKVSLYGVTPVVQRASASQAIVVTTVVGSAEESTNYAFTTQAQSISLMTEINEIRDTLVAYGIMKGA